MQNEMDGSEQHAQPGRQLEGRSLDSVVRKLLMLEKRVRDLEAASACPTGTKVNRLKLTRVSRGMTQKQLADALGLDSEIWVSRWETGRTKPDEGMKLKIAEILGVRKWEIFA